MKESPSRSAHLDIGVLFLYLVPSDITTVVSVSFDSTYSETEADLKEKRKMGMDQKSRRDRDWESHNPPIRGRERFMRMSCEHSKASRGG